MPAGKSGPTRRWPFLFILVGLAAVTALGACAGKSCTASAGATALDADGAAGCGGRFDRIYNEIYAPGNPRWSDF